MYQHPYPPSPTPPHTHLLPHHTHAWTQMLSCWLTGYSQVCYSGSASETELWLMPVHCLTFASEEPNLQPWNWCCRTQVWMIGSLHLRTLRPWSKKRPVKGPNGTTKPSIFSPVWASVWGWAMSGVSPTCAKAMEEVSWGWKAEGDTDWAKCMTTIGYVDFECKYKVISYCRLQYSYDVQC